MGAGLAPRMTGRGATGVERGGRTAVERGGRTAGGIRARGGGTVVAADRGRDRLLDQGAEQACRDPRRLWCRRDDLGDRLRPRARGKAQAHIEECQTAVWMLLGVAIFLLGDVVVDKRFGPRALVAAM